jgi:uncharacterized phage infection (PIP) family protein YhgE
VRLYSLNDTAAVVDPETGEQYNADAQGAFEIPAEFGAQLHATYFESGKIWETDTERVERLAAEDYARQQDPATLLAEVRALRESLTSGNPSAADIRSAADKAAAEAANLAQQADAAEVAEKAAADAAEKAAAEALAAEEAPDVVEPTPDVAEVPEGAPTLDGSVEKINSHLDDLKSGDDAELYEAEQLRLVAGEAETEKPRKGLVEGPHATETEGLI